jgi:hypothetical protein
MQQHQHLLGIGQLQPADIQLILDTATQFKGSPAPHQKFPPAGRGHCQPLPKTQPVQDLFELAEKGFPIPSIFFFGFFVFKGRIPPGYGQQYPVDEGRHGRYEA